MNTPAFVWTGSYGWLVAYTLQVVQPDLSCASTERISDERSIVPVVHV